MNKEYDLKRLNEIRDYVTKNHPESIFVTNYDGVSFNEISDIDNLSAELNLFFWSEYMQLCECGYPDKVQKIIKKYLKVIKDSGNNEDINDRKDIMKKVFKVDFVYDNALLLFLAYVLDAYKFTEHGRSIGEAYLTELGEMYLNVLTIYLKN